MKEGAIDYMAKPFAPEVLLNMVSRYAPIKSDDNGDAIVADEKSIKLMMLADKVAKRTPMSWFWARAALVKRWCPRYIHNASNRKDVVRSSRLIVRQFLTICWKRLYLDMRKVHLLALFRRVRVSLNKLKAVQFYSMWDQCEMDLACKPSCCVCCKSVKLSV